MRYYQSGHVQRQDDVCHGKGLAGTCNAKKSLELVALFEAFCKSFDGLGLASVRF